MVDASTESAVLLAQAGDLDAADAHAVATLTDETVVGVLVRVPDALLAGSMSSGDFATAEEARERYTRYGGRSRRSPKRCSAFARDAQL